MIRKALCTPRSRWRRLLLISGMVAIALGIIAMHQLSGQHPPSVPETAAAGMHAVQAPPSHLTDHTMAASMGGDLNAGLMGTCATDGCEQHAMMMGCLLALTLLVLGWHLRMPSTHPRPPTSEPYRPRWALPVLPVLSRCPSLVELSISRT